MTPTTLRAETPRSCLTPWDTRPDDAPREVWVMGNPRRVGRCVPRWCAVLGLVVACESGGTGAAGGSSGSTTGTETTALPGTTQVGSTGLPSTTAVADASSGSSTTADASSSSSTGTPDQGYPDPNAWPSQSGPGGPAVAFDAEALYQNCAFLDGGASDADHHNLVMMFDGYLMMPWAPEFGAGGLTFFDVSDPCSPAVVGSNTSGEMRETHAVGFSEVAGRWYAVVTHVDEGLLNTGGGIMFWDVTDPMIPLPLTSLGLPGHLYPDAYARVVQSVFWQGDYVYVGGSDNGLYIVDASDPINPVLVHQEAFDPTLRVGQVQVVGNLLIATAAEGPRTVLVDISLPDAPQPIAGGDFTIEDAEGVAREAYFANMAGGLVWYAIKSGGGGLLAYDVRNPSNPTYAGHFDSGGNGGYVFVKDDHAIVGESTFAGIYDISDLSDIQSVAQLDLEGDLDTATPIGNVIVLSVDDESTPDQASAIAPYLATPDVDAPHVTWSVPADGASGLPVTSRVGVTFNEMVAPKSAWEGSVRLYETGSDPLVKVEGSVNVQESIVNFSPRSPLQPGTEYTFEIPADGIVDYNGNAVAQGFSITFTTAGG